MVLHSQVHLLRIMLLVFFFFIIIFYFPVNAVSC